MQTNLTINQAMCDYLSLAGWAENETYPELKALFDVVNQMNHLEAVDAKVMQYNGLLTPHSFVGTGEIKNKLHNYFYASGATSNWVVGFEVITRINCTRIDVQMTIQAKMDLFKLAERLKPRKTIGYWEKQQLATCYIGAMASTKLIRVYMKSQDLLRFEVQYRHKRADAMYKHLQGHTHKEVENLMLAWLAYEISGVNDNQLTALFKPYLTQQATKTPPVPRPETSTEKWLQETVLPVLYRYANSHDANQHIINSLKDALK